MDEWTEGGEKVLLARSIPRVGALAPEGHLQPPPLPSLLPWSKINARKWVCTENGPYIDKIISGKLSVKDMVNFEDDELQEAINRMINIANLEEYKEVDNVPEII